MFSKWKNCYSSSNQMDAKRKLKILQDNYPEGTFRVYTRKWKGRDKTKYYVQTLERKGAKR